MITGTEDRGWLGGLLGLLALVASAGPGLRLLGWIGRPRDVVAGAAVGMGLAAQIVVALGWCGLAFPEAGRMLLKLWILVCLASAPRQAWTLFAGEVRALWRESRWMTGCAGGLLLAALAATTMPPLIHDAVAYHLLLPQQYAFVHKVHVMPSFMPTAFPHLSTGGFLWMLLVNGGWRAAGILTWSWLPVAALGAARLCRRLGGRGATGLLGVCLVPLLLVTGSAPLADVPGTALALLAIATAADGGRARWPVAGLLCGLAAGTKYNAGFCAAAGCLALMPITGRRAATWSAAMMLPVVPLVLSNLASFGAPFFPLLSSAPQSALVAAWNRALALAPRSAVGALLWPLWFLWDAASFIRKELGQVGAGLIGLYAVGTVVRGGPALRLGVAAWLVWFAAFFGCWPPRYLLPVMGVAVALGGAAAARFRFGREVFLAVLALAAAPHLRDQVAGTVAWVRSGATSDQWVAGSRWPSPPGAVCAFLRGLPRTATIAPVFEAQVFWAGRRFAPALMHDRPVVFREAGASRTPADLADRLRRRGMTHLLFALNMDMIQAPQWRAWCDDRELGLVLALAGDRRRIVYADDTHVVTDLRRLTGSGALR